MNELEITLFQAQWRALMAKLGEQFGEEPDLQAVLFLIGVQELGRGPQEFSKDEKQDLMHIATCRLLSDRGYYILENTDADGWPHYRLLQPLPLMSLKEQDLLLKQAVLEYFNVTGI
jgi:hypothetical protein